MPGHRPARIPFTGKITINTGKVTGLTPITMPAGSSAQANGKTLSFAITSRGQVNGFRFTTEQAASVTCTLKVNGAATTAGQICLGGTPTPSPLTFTR